MNGTSPVGPQTGWWIEASLDENGPVIRLEGCTPKELAVMAQAMRDAALAVGNGDDPGEVARVEWRRQRPSAAFPATAAWRNTPNRLL